MKNIMTVICVMLALVLSGQNAPKDKEKGRFGNGTPIEPNMVLINPTYDGSTTNEEYKYMSVGIAESINSGLDIKKGYTLNGLDNFSALENYKYVDNYYSFVFADLARKDKTIAGTVAKIYSRVSGKTYFMAIPNGDFEQDIKFKEKLAAFDGDITKAFMFAYIRYIRPKLPKQ